MKCSWNILFNVPQWWKCSVISCLICHKYANEVFFKYACHYHTRFHLNIGFCWSCISWCERIKTVSMNILYICNLNSSVSRKTPVLSDVDNFGHGFEFNENGAPHQKNKSGPGPPTSLTRPCQRCNTTVTKGQTWKWKSGALLVTHSVFYLKQIF